MARRAAKTIAQHSTAVSWQACRSPRRRTSTTAVMCKHVLNAQVAIRSPCCKKWFDCAECHAEQADHALTQSFDMTFICKKCKKAFRKDAREFEDADEYCPHCDNHFVLDALTPKASLQVEGEDARIDSRMLKDGRVRAEEQRSIFDVKEAPNKLG